MSQPGESDELTIDQLEKLVEESRSSREVFTKIYHYLLPRIYAYIYNRVGGKEHIAQDVTSMTFEAIVIGLPNYEQRKQGNFRAFAYRIAHNKVIDYYRKNKRAFAELDESTADSVRGESLGVSDAISDEEHHIIKITILELKPRYQEILTLKFYSELSVPEIAEAMNEKPRNVSVILHRALKALQKKVKYKLN